jgi:hypothetical protein
VKKHYIIDTDLLFSFLSRSNTEKSKVEMDKHSVKNERCRTVMDNFGKTIKSLLLDAAEILSERYETRSNVTISSRNSSVKSELMKKRMQVKAQQTQLAFTEKQLELQKEKALLEVQLNLLEQRKKLATLETEIQVLEDHDSSYKSECNLSGFKEPIALSKEKFTAYFVNGRTQFSDAQSTGQKEVTISDNIVSPPTCGLSNPYVQEFRFSSHFGVATELTQFLLKKDLLLSRFSSFDDQPDSFETWKTTFTHHKGIECDTL